MKFLLAAVNAKYIHSNLGIYSLKKYADSRLKQSGEKQEKEPSGGGPAWEIEIGEYTINHRTDDILRDIYRRAPDAVGFSCYIWNILYIRELVHDLKKILPDTEIWLGGPEVSYRASELLREEPYVRGIMAGEGEETFYRLLRAAGERTSAGSIWKDQALSLIPGLVFRALGADGENREDGKNRKDGENREDGKVRAEAEIVTTPPAPLLDLNEIPFAYGDLQGLEHRIIYYESSRGCPFSCSYCLSSIDKSVRFRDLELVKEELAFFLEKKVPQVKFVDRTFNCRKSHSMAVWQFILENDNGITNFHFEISADLLSEEELALLSKMRPGLVQLEIGVQTTNPRTIKEIRRKMDLGRLQKNVEKIGSFHNIHQHLDLIAGLPFEGFESFRRSFNEVFAMRPEQLQLGFLKVLSGSHMMEMAAEYSLRYKEAPPYEVLSTRWLSYGELLRLKGVEEMVETYYNSGQFENTLEALAQEFDSPFDMFSALSVYYEENGLSAVSHSRLARYEILFRFIGELLEKKRARYEQKTPEKEGGDEAPRELPAGQERLEEYRDRLILDVYLRENAKSRPSFARDLSPFREAVKAFFIEEGKSRRYLKGYEEYDSRQMGKMAHIEVLRDGTMVLFDYLHRDALLGNAKIFQVGQLGEVRRQEEAEV